jgi:hypothetical protein
MTEIEICEQNVTFPSVYNNIEQKKIPIPMTKMWNWFTHFPKMSYFSFVFCHLNEMSTLVHKPFACHSEVQE